MKTLSENEFVPLKTIQGYDKKKLNELFSRKKVCIWGMGFQGKILYQSLKNQGFRVTYYCDQNVDQQRIGKTKIIDIGKALELAKNGKIVLIISVVTHIKEIEDTCLSFGLIKNKDFINIRNIRRPEISIDISKKCNLECPSCPQANLYDPNQPQKLMSLHDFSLVMKKLLSSRIGFSKIEFGWWSEPLINPALPEMINLCKGKIISSINTNLLNIDHLFELNQASPDMIVVSIGGLEEDYERSYFRGSWEKLVKNLRILKQTFEGNQTTQLRLLFHIYKDSNIDLFDKFARKLKFRYATTYGYLNPYEHYLEFLRKGKFSSALTNVVNQLAWDPSDYLNKAKKQVGKPCLCQRIFPIINADLSVALCHVYGTKIVSKNFLNVSLEDLISKRHDHPFCKTCQSQGLHRLDIELMKNTEQNT